MCLSYWYASCQEWRWKQNSTNKSPYFLLWKKHKTAISCIISKKVIRKIANLMNCKVDFIPKISDWLFMVRHLKLTFRWRFLYPRKTIFIFYQGKVQSLGPYLLLDFLSPRCSWRRWWWHISWTRTRDWKYNSNQWHVAIPMIITDIRSQNLGVEV